jgi:hypothetical protein
VRRRDAERLPDGGAHSRDASVTVPFLVILPERWNRRIADSERRR